MIGPLKTIRATDAGIVKKAMRRKEKETDSPSPL